MNEELESTNEELRATNEELRRRSSDMDGLNSFLESILGSMQAGVVVLDPNFAVRTWNRKAEDLWGLRAEEVQGQPFFNLDFGLPLEELRQSIRACVGGDGQPQRLVVDARNRRGKAIKCAVRCAPLSADGGRKEGVLLLMEQTE